MGDDERPARERDDENKPGAEGGASESKDRPPAAPADEAGPVGDTDQHSGADA